ncbi:hypothetical protein ACFYY2_01275 [Streptomyces sp. NPDC001822]|uniref:hypothetical protein n=1 Tax=Streptomyces sp. NPDC001822 TaxID=3364614 RepID=UPI00369EE7A9
MLGVVVPVEHGVPEVGQAGAGARAPDGLAARLDRTHGGAWIWERAVTDTRAAYATELDQDEHEGQRPTLRPEWRD